MGAVSLGVWGYDFERGIFLKLRDKSGDQNWALVKHLITFSSEYIYVCSLGGVVFGGGGGGIAGANSQKLVTRLTIALIDITSFIPKRSFQINFFLAKEVKTWIMCSVLSFFPCKTSMFLL